MSISIGDDQQTGGEFKNAGIQLEAEAKHPKQTFWIKVKVAKSSMEQFLERKNIPMSSTGVDVKGTFKKNLTHQMLIHLPREGLFWQKYHWTNL